MDGRLRRDAEVDLAADDGARDAPVLRRAGFRDVHVRHDLEAYRDRGPVGFVQAADLAQHAVDAVADAQETLFRFEVNVRGAALDRVGEHDVDEAHERLAVLLDIALVIGVVRLAGFDFAQDAVDRQFVTVELVDRIRDFGLAREYRHQFDMLADLDANAIQREQVERVRHRDGQRAAHRIVVQRNDLVLARGVRIDHLDRVGIGHHARQVDAFLLERLAERGAHDRLGGETEIDQQFSERFVNLLLLGQRNVELILGDDTFVDQDLAEPLGFVLRVHNRPRTSTRCSTTSLLKVARPLPRFSSARR